MENFIGEYQIDPSFCEEAIRRFESNPKKFSGVCSTGEILDNHKKSTDLSLNDDLELFNLYMEKIRNFIKDYVEGFNIFQSDGQIITKQFPNIQRYLPNEGFFGLHFERPSITVADRELVFMTYLNTLSNQDNQGSTEFPYQNYFGKPFAGNTLIWPAGFTHKHRGIPHKTETKYIITGWLNWVY